MAQGKIDLGKNIDQEVALEKGKKRQTNQEGS